MIDKKRLIQAVQDGKIVDDKSLALFQIIEDASAEADRMEKISNEFDTKSGNADEKINKAVETITERAQKDIDEKISKIEVKQGEKGEKGDGVIGPQGPIGPVGRQGPQGESIPGPQGEKGKDADEEKIIQKIETDLPQLGEKIRDALELLQGDDRLDAKYIKNLDERFKAIEKSLDTKQNVGGVAGRDVFQDIDISAQFDGIKTTFNIPAVWKIITVDLSSYPYGSLRKNIDYTWTPTSITFTSNIDPTTQLSIGQNCILTVVTSP